jgi:uncharacterized protein (DUF169 family)
MSKLEKGSKERVEYSKKLKKTLHLHGSPVAMALLREPPEGVPLWPGESTGVCKMVQSARRGEVFYCTAKEQFCPGASYLGMVDLPNAKWGAENYLSSAKKLYSARAVANRHMMRIGQRTPRRMGDFLAFAPLEKATFQPDVVVFIVKPLQGMRLIFLEGFDTGIYNTSHMEPMCVGTMSTPMSMGMVGLSLFCPGSRQTANFLPEEMGVGMPYETLYRVVRNIEFCHLGTASPDNEAMAKVPGRSEVLNRYEMLDQDIYSSDDCGCGM